MVRDLPDESIVVYGGVMSIDTIEASLRTNEGTIGIPCLSIFSLPHATFEEVAKKAARPNNKLRATTAGRLRAAGYLVTSWNPITAHARIEFTRHPGREDLARLIGVFDPPVDNPFKQDS